MIKSENVERGYCQGAWLINAPFLPGRIRITIYFETMSPWDYVLRDRTLKFKRHSSWKTEGRILLTSIFRMK